MKISLHWLKEYVEITASPSELADLLTAAGLEVEDLSEWKPGFQGVKVAQLVSFEPFPQSNHLFICQVSDGHKKYSIVCGASNLRSGGKVPLALEGAILPGGMRIKTTDFQGFVSEGMLCSENELGLSDDGSGIMLLDETLPLGMDLENALSLKDWIFNINITPNRPDCLCILGVAREIAALTGKKIRFPQDGNRPPAPTAATDLTSVRIERPDLCPRYVAKIILGTQIAPSPFWMRQKLQAMGVRAINNIVDVTNYVMLELGQPLHAFDFDRLAEKRIVVQAATEGQLFTTLDGVDRSLPDEALMICDGEKSVALAGIMGGLNSEVVTETTNILLESAYFEPMGIRRTSKKIGLSTEASLRFEKGIDPNGCLRAAERAADLMFRLGGGKLAQGAADNYPRVIEPQRIFLRTTRANEILGTAISSKEIEKTFLDLDCLVAKERADFFEVIVPTYRVDLRREIDLIEEIACLHGYDKIPATLPVGKIAKHQKSEKQKLTEKARELLASFGFWEVINYSFISTKMLRDLRIPAEDERNQAVRITNPINEDQSIMRTTLLPGLLQVAQTNFFRQNMNLRFFEIGRVFFKRDGQELPEEFELLSGLITGSRWEESWVNNKEECDFFDLRGAVEMLLRGLGISHYIFSPAREEACLHPGKACWIQSGSRTLGGMGEIHPEVNEALDLDQKILVFELNFKNCLDSKSFRRKYKPIARYPFMTRDLACIVDQERAAGDLWQALWEVNNGWIQEINLFDVYEGHPIPSGKKSLAFRIRYQREDRTLTDGEVDEVHKKLIATLFQRFGAILR